MTESQPKVKRSQWFKSLLMRNSSGSTAVSFAVALPAILGAVGVATDYGILEMKRSHLQSVADQSAIAAVRELSLANSKDTTVESVADSYAHSMVEEDNSTLEVSVSVDEAAGKVGVILKEKWTPFFAHFISADVTPVVVNATAKLAGKSNLCVLALDPVAAKSIHMDKTAKIVANGCTVYSNSSHRQGIRLDQDSSMKSSLTCSVGGVQAKTSAIVPSPITDCAPIADPLAGRTAPTLGVCVGNSIDIDKGNVTLSPGRYCKGLKITGKAKVTFQPGNYIIEDGKFEISGSASVISENAAFYLKGENTTLQFTENTSLQLKGAKDGPMAGLLFFEERSVSKGRVHRINSVNASELTGTIYLPNGHLRIDPTTPVAQDSAYTAIIARTVELNEGPTLVLNDDYSDSNVPVPEGIQMSSQIVLAN